MSNKSYLFTPFRWCFVIIRNLFYRLWVRLYSSRLILCPLLLMLTVLTWVGHPKFIFQTNLHLPWLTHVQHVQPLRCLPVTGQPDWPQPVRTNENRWSESNQLTVVIVTARPEFQRLPVTLAALTCHLDRENLTEVILLVPPKDVTILQRFFASQQASVWPWPVSIRSDDALLRHTHTNSYRLQMLFKLFLAQMVQTEYYLILDSDCVAVWPIHVEQLLYRTTELDEQQRNRSSYRAIYQIEGKLGHQGWWSESEELLQSSLQACVSTSPELSPTMGVTPSILSRTIALRTLCRLQTLYGDDRFLDKMANWALWRLIVGRMWTEYTLYYLTGRCTKLFDTYHIHHSDIPASRAFPSLSLYGFSIWALGEWTSENRQRLVETIEHGLNWRTREVEQSAGRAIVEPSGTSHSLFTVLQGRQGTDPSLYHQAFYPLFIRHLRQRNQTVQLVKLLDQITEQLLTLKK